MLKPTIGVIGTVISISLFFTPVLTFYKIIKENSVGEYKPDPYLAIMMNCGLWVVYRMPFVHPDSKLIVIINGIGLVFGSVYLTMFWIYATNQGRRKVNHILIGGLILFAVIVSAILMAVHGTHQRSLAVGIVCVIFNVVMYISPLTVMGEVIRTKSVKYMPFLPSLLNLVNGVCWTFYSLIHPIDLFILISNAMGVLSGIVQLILYAWYCSCKGNQDGGDGNHVQPQQP